MFQPTRRHALISSVLQGMGNEVYVRLGVRLCKNASPGLGNLVK
jgi:hypothetical protein